MKHRIICVVEVEASSEAEAKNRINIASNYEKWHGVTITPVDLKKKFSEPKKNGTETAKPQDPMSAIRAEVRRTKGTPF